MQIVARLELVGEFVERVVSGVIEFADHARPVRNAADRES